MAALLTVDNLSHRYNAQVSLSFASFAVTSGELLLVRGPSGCGKSTLLHLLGGVIPIGSNAGAAVIDGQALTALTGAERDALRPFVVGWMPQRHSMINSISVL
ncbi:MAG TPA: ATP-binding cassette domain-containing protein, partial [Casimicrobium sp.]|nr:ATP-binding cassette domain-containing protein [Casimicrobium sp.]